MKCPKCGYNVGEVKPTPQYEIDEREIAKKYLKKMARRDFKKGDFKKNSFECSFGINRMINALVEKTKRKSKKPQKSI